MTSPCNHRLGAIISPILDTNTMLFVLLEQEFKKVGRTVRPQSYIQWLVVIHVLRQQTSMGEEHTDHLTDAFCLIPISTPLYGADENFWHAF